MQTGTLGSVHSTLPIALALAMPKSGSLAIAVLAKEWVGMPTDIAKASVNDNIQFPFF